MSSTASRKSNASHDETHNIEETHPTKGVKTSPSTSQPNNNEQVTTEQSEQARRLYDDTLRIIDRNIRVMDKRVFKDTFDGNMDYTMTDYAKLVHPHFTTVKRIAALDIALAFNLVVSMAEASHNDNSTAPRWTDGSSDEWNTIFKALDSLLLLMIKARERPAELDSELLKVPTRWSRRPEWDLLPDPVTVSDLGHEARFWEKCNYEYNRRVARRRRREVTEDWVTVTLTDLRDDREFLGQQPDMATTYLDNSIHKLEKIWKEMKACS
ncbi:glycoside hydrolase family 43 [Fusarium longipes]|uniref:Glycoside hydrolase family 43 n=1 Tax=Fusarium longipes TaxID=694270 RepID=A0A395T8N6_9HYPO|nr:glycoside hydrolase family 43 [Fusarium longipes]